MATSRAQQSRQNAPGLHALFGAAYKDYPEEWRSLYEIEKSERNFEEELKIVGLGLATIKDEGKGVQYDVGSQEGPSFKYVHETIGLGFVITEEAQDDNLYDSMSKRLTRMLAKSFKTTKNVKAATMFNLGFTTFTIGDGKTVFATDHPLNYGGVNANRPSVHADLNETSLEAACITIWGWTDERGIPLQYNPVSLHVPKERVFDAERLTKTVLQTNTGNNTINATYSMGILPKGSEVNHFFTDPGAWFLKTDVVNGAKHFVRKSLKMSELPDFDTGNIRYKGVERYSFGISDYLQYYGVSGT